MHLPWKDSSKRRQCPTAGRWSKPDKCSAGRAYTTAPDWSQGQWRDGHQRDTRLQWPSHSISCAMLNGGQAGIETRCWLFVRRPRVRFRRHWQPCLLGVVLGKRLLICMQLTCTNIYGKVTISAWSYWRQCSGSSSWLVHWTNRRSRSHWGKSQNDCWVCNWWVDHWSHCCTLHDCLDTGLLQKLLIYMQRKNFRSLHLSRQLFAKCAQQAA